jgi:hypothetical protein
MVTEMKRKDHFIARKVGGCLLLVPTGSRVIDLNGLITLNHTALCIWEHLDGQHSVSEIADVLTEKFDVDLDQAGKDVQVFINQIDQMGLLE